MLILICLMVNAIQFGLFITFDHSKFKYGKEAQALFAYALLAGFCVTGLMIYGG